MRLPLVFTLVFLVLNLGLDFYYFTLLRRHHLKLWSWVLAGTTVLLLAMAIVSICQVMNNPSLPQLTAAMWMFYAYATIYVPKWIYALFRLLSFIPELWHGEQWKIVAKIGLVISVIWCLWMWEGALVQRKLLDVKEVTVSVENLPEGFDGYRIVQISDLHSGTFNGDNSFTARLVDRVNGLNPDLVAFTGDFVNSRSNELEPHISTLARLKARDGVYSVLGNHDYGDYSRWPSLEAKEANLQQLRQMQHKMGWTLLDNKTVFIKHNGDSLALIGVENIGDPPFKTYGSLKKAYPTLDDEIPKVLLTHNPAHWRDSIQGHDNINIPLTLSGHTHAMQMEVMGFSPAKWRYENWGGLYGDKDNKHQLYVNIGAGTVGFPSRLGATPEITVITLKKK